MVLLFDKDGFNRGEIVFLDKFDFAEKENLKLKDKEQDSTVWTWDLTKIEVVSKPGYSHISYGICSVPFDGSILSRLIDILGKMNLLKLLLRMNLQEIY